MVTVLEWHLESLLTLKDCGHTVYLVSCLSMLATKYSFITDQHPELLLLLKQLERLDELLKVLRDGFLYFNDKI